MASWYLDSSAVVKLVLAEEHSGAMSRFAREHAEGLVASDLVVTEVLRAVRRIDVDLLDQALAVLDGLALVHLPRERFRAAGVLDPLGLRTLDALHIQAALVLGEDLAGLVTYDGRLADAARHQAVVPLSPGRDGT